MSNNATRAPSDAIRIAVARPMPVDPPVTITRFPLRSAMFVSCLIVPLYTCHRRILPILGRGGGVAFRGQVLDQYVTSWAHALHTLEKRHMVQHTRSDLGLFEPNHELVHDREVLGVRAERVVSDEIEELSKKPWRVVSVFQAADEVTMKIDFHPS